MSILEGIIFIMLFWDTGSSVDFVLWKMKNHYAIDTLKVSSREFFKIVIAWVFVVYFLTGVLIFHDYVVVI